MKKTFRRALACLLAVLMVAFSMPFTALAVESNRKWWIDDGVDPSTITEEPDYVGYNDIDQELGSWELAYGAVIDLINDKQGLEDHRDDWKPIIAVTVSSQGDASITSATYSQYYNTYYGSSTANTYEVVKEAGLLLDPNNLKAGQRIAVTVEFGGFDTVCNGQFIGTYDTDALQAAYYPSEPFSGRGGSDTWTAVNTFGSDAVIATGSTLNCYGAALAFMGQSVDPVNGVFKGSVVGARFLAAETTKSNFIGTGLNNIKGTRPYGKYGHVSFVYSFEVLQDCKLSDVWHFGTGAGETIFEPYAREATQFLDGNSDANVGKYLITFDDTELTFANWAPVIWSEATADEEETTKYTVKFVDINGDEVSSASYAKGTAADDVVVPDNTTSTDPHTTYVWPTIADVTADVTYTETTDTTEHTYTSEVTKAADCGNDGTRTYTCTICGDQYTEVIPATGNHNYVADDSTYVAPSCKDGKEADLVCSVCGATITGDPIPATGEHNYVEVPDTAVAATCGTAGKEADKECTVCGDYVTGAVIPATGEHNYVEVPDTAVAATCGTAGKEADKECTVCGDYVTGAVIPATGEHNYVEVPDTAVEATCTTPGKAADQKCTVCGDVITGAETAINPDNHAYGEWTVTVAPTYEKAGTETRVCAYNAEHVETREIAKLEGGINVTVTATDLGTSTVENALIDTKTVLTEDVTSIVALNSDVTLTATPAVGATFVGWAVNDKIIYTDATVTVKALADVTYTPVFELAGAKFTVIFTDQYGNVIKTQEVESAAEIVAPTTVPTIAGYTFVGWSLDLETITESATVNAVYEKNQDAKFTVTADGCTITTPAGTTEGTATDVAFDTLVTVTAEGAKAWKMNDAVVAYGETYSFYVGSNVTLVPVFDAVTATPTVASVSQTELDVDGFIKVSFLATRSIPEESGCTFVSAGFVYGKNLANDDITLADVDGATVKAYYCATNAEQFALTYSLAAQSGKMTVRPFLAYVDADGATQVIYADVVPGLTTYTYA